MSGFELYVFCLCLVVFVALTALFSVMLAVLLKQGHKAIKHGLEDERIKKEYDRETRQGPVLNIVSTVLTIIMLAVLFSGFAASVSIKLTDGKVVGDSSVPKVVLSDSMSVKRASNTYLEENGLDDQFDMFDLLFVEELPGEYELELYDVVVYEYEDTQIIHRIIGIEEPNEKHPDGRHFLLRGDALKFSDEFPVLYSQMKAIYRGERIPYIGSFFMFMQSPAGYMCILLVLFAVIGTPIAEKKLWKAKLARLVEIGYITQEDIGKKQFTKSKK